MPATLALQLGQGRDIRRCCQKPWACRLALILHLLADQVIEFNKWRGFGHIAMDQKDWYSCACHFACLVREYAR